MEWDFLVTKLILPGDGFYVCAECRQFRGLSGPVFAADHELAHSVSLQLMILTVAVEFVLLIHRTLFSIYTDAPITASSCRRGAIRRIVR
jgi:hypothetical protein